MTTPVAVEQAGLKQCAARSGTSGCRFRNEVRPTDRQAVRALVESTGFFRCDEINIAVELVNEHLAHGTQSGYHFVFAEFDMNLAGYACFGPIPCTTVSYDLYWVAVDSRHQRLGIGRTLVSAVEARVAAMGGERIYIDTSGKDQYAPTRVFYERNGYHCDARLKDFYAPGDDRVIYVKVLEIATKP